MVSLQSHLESKMKALFDKNCKVEWVKSKISPLGLTANMGDIYCVRFECVKCLSHHFVTDCVMFND